MVRLSFFMKLNGRYHRTTRRGGRRLNLSIRRVISAGQPPQTVQLLGHATQRTAGVDGMAGTSRFLCNEWHCKVLLIYPEWDILETLLTRKPTFCETVVYRLESLARHLAVP